MSGDARRGITMRHAVRIGADCTHFLPLPLVKEVPFD